MITENISTLKIQKLTKDQFQNGLENNILDDTSIYLTPTEIKDYAEKSDLATKADLIDGKVPANQIPEDIVDLSNYYTKEEVNTSLTEKASLIDGKVPAEQIPEGIVDLSDYYTKTEIDEEIDSTKENFNIELLKKADLIDGKIPTSQLPDDIGECLTEVDWEDIKNKPFGKTGLKIEWDGETSDKEHLGIVDGFDFYRISSDILTNDKLIGATIKTYFDGDFIEGEISQDGDIAPVQTASGNLIVMYGGQLPICLIASQEGEDNFMGVTFSILLTGVWFFHGSGEEEYTHYLQKDYEIKKIDKEYLPDDIGGGVTSWNDLTDKPFGEEGFKLEWDGNTESALNVLPLDGTGLILYQVSEDFVFSEDVIGAIVGFEADGSDTFTVDKNIITRFDSGNTDSFMLMYNSFPWVYNIVEPETISAMGMSVDFPSAGIWFTGVDGESVYTTLFDNYSLKKIDKKFLPDDIGNGGGNVNVDLSNYYTKTQVDSIATALEGKITSTFCYKGTVDNYLDLPTENNTIGDVWNITNADEANGVNAGDNAAWNGTGWDILAGVIDLSNYYTKTEVDSIVLNGVANLTNYYTKAESNNLYYTKTQIDDMIGNCDTIINSINTLIGGGTA